MPADVILFPARKPPIQREPQDEVEAQRPYVMREVWHCYVCDRELFYVGREGVQCAKCNAWQAFP